MKANVDPTLVTVLHAEAARHVLTSQTACDWPHQTGTVQKYQ